MAIKFNGQTVVPTIFPDGTSQVWKLDGLPCGRADVVWDFENEAEVMHVLQLLALLSREAEVVALSTPFLPYGRQDKLISNNKTFALSVLASAIAPYVDIWSTVDAHSDALDIEIGHDIQVEDKFPLEAIEAASVGADGLCFPDAGAYGRYYYDLPLKPKLILQKDRDQSTGEITGLSLRGDVDIPPGMSILIVDDICDGGRTFIEASKLLHSIEPTCHIWLYVSHGIFSKGVGVLRDAGIERIFTKDGEVV